MIILSGDSVIVSLVNGEPKADTVYNIFYQHGDTTEVNVQVLSDYNKFVNVEIHRVICKSDLLLILDSRTKEKVSEIEVGYETVKYGSIFPGSYIYRVIPPVDSKSACDYISDLVNMCIENSEREMYQLIFTDCNSKESRTNILIKVGDNTYHKISCSKSPIETKIDTKGTRTLLDSDVEYDFIIPDDHVILVEKEDPEDLYHDCGHKGEMYVDIDFNNRYILGSVNRVLKEYDTNCNPVYLYYFYH